MTEDPLIEEARKAGQAYIDSFKGDWKAMVEDLRRREEQARREGRRVVSLPPKPPRVRASGQAPDTHDINGQK